MVNCYVSVKSYQVEVERAAREFRDNLIKDGHEELLKKTYHRNLEYCFIFKDGTEVHFVNENCFRRWSLGRTYKFLGDESGDIYSGGYLWKKGGE